MLPGVSYDIVKPPKKSDTFRKKSEKVRWGPGVLNIVDLVDQSDMEQAVESPIEKSTVLRSQEPGFHKTNMKERSKKLKASSRSPVGGTFHSTPKLSRRQKGQEGCPKESKEDRRTKVMPPIAQLHEDHQKYSWILHPNSKSAELNNNKKKIYLQYF